MIKKISILKTKEDFMNIIVGGAFLGSGGGGPIEAAIEMMNEILNKNKEIKVYRPEELLGKNNLNGAVVAFVGSPTAGTRGIDFNSPVNALESLKVFTPNNTIDFTLQIELGAGNSMASIMVAALRDLFIVDGDGAARAVPKIQMTTYALNATPVPAAFSNGIKDDKKKVSIDNIIMMKGISSELIPDKLEEYCLELCETKEFDGMGGMALYLMNGDEVNKNVIPYTLSLMYYLGSEINKAFNSNLSFKPVEALKIALNNIKWKFYTFENAKVIKIKKIESENGKGLDKGFVILENINGDIMEINYVNENLFSILKEKDNEKEKIWAMAPDLISYMSNENYGALSNVELREGMIVTIFGLKSDIKIRNSRIIKAFEETLNEFNIYDGEYIPIENLHN